MLLKQAKRHPALLHSRAKIKKKEKWVWKGREERREPKTKTEKEAKKWERREKLMTEGKGKARGGIGGSMTASGSSNGRRRPYALLLLLAVGAAVLSVVILQKMRERRVFGVLLQERDSQLLSLQLLLEKEKAANKEIKKKFDELKAKSSSLRTQRMELNDKLMESESATAYLKVMQQELESALVDKENQIKDLQQRTSDDASKRVAQLTQIIQQKDAEIEDLKRRLNRPQRTEEQQKVTESSTTPETRASQESSEGGSKEEKWVKFKTNLEDKMNQNSDEHKEGRGDLEVEADGESVEKGIGGSEQGNYQENKWELPEKKQQMMQDNTMNENGNIDSTAASVGEGAKNEVNDQQAVGN